VLYKIEDDGAQSVFNMVTGTWTEGKVLVEGGGKNKSAAYTEEAEGGLIQGNPQSCKILTLEGEETEVVEALKKVMGGGNFNGPSLQVLTSNLKKVA
jgi:hypothetical protein